MDHKAKLKIYADENKIALYRYLPFTYVFYQEQIYHLSTQNTQN